MVGKRKITILMLQDSMWQGGETYDEPGDFDEGERKAEKGMQEIARAVAVKTDSTSTVNIHIVNNVGREMGENRREAEHQEIVKLMKEVMQTRDAVGKTGEEKQRQEWEWLKAENGTGSTGAADEDLSRQNGEISEIVKEPIVEAEATDWGMIIAIFLGVGIVILIIIILVIRYR